MNWAAKQRRNVVQLHFETRSYGDVAVLDCSGRLVYREEAQALCDRVAELLRAYRSVVVNLGGVNVIDGAGLGSLVSCVEKAHELGRNVTWYGLQANIRKLVDLTRLFRVLDVFETESQAIDACRVAA
jgi:stage II sporulation protein AA (anti-sigma F factor antagonist)